MSNVCHRESKDLVANKKKFMFVWGFPMLLMLVVWFMTLPKLVVCLTWIASLLWMGFACVFNSCQCGRRHCAYSGPYFLLAALFLLLMVLNIVTFVSLEQAGLALLITIPAICILPDFIWGAYRKS